MTRIRKQLLATRGHEPTPEELAAELSLPIERVIENLQVDREPVSLDTPLESGGVGRGQAERVFGDVLEDVNVTNPADAALSTLMNEEVRKMLELLDDREEKVIRMRFGLDDGMPKSLEETGQAIGVTRERARQIENKTLAKLRVSQNSDRLKPYLRDD